MLQLPCGMLRSGKLKMNSTEQQPVSAYDTFLTSKELALRWGLEDNTLRKLRTQMQGPAWIKFTFGVRYRLADVLAYEQDGKKIHPKPHLKKRNRHGNNG